MLRVPKEVCTGTTPAGFPTGSRRDLLSAESAVGPSQDVSSGIHAQDVEESRPRPTTLQDAGSLPQAGTGARSHAAPALAATTTEDRGDSLVQGLLPFQILDAQGAQDSVHQGLVLEDDPTEAVQERHGVGRVSRHPLATTSRSTGSDPAPVSNPPPRPQFRTGSYQPLLLPGLWACEDACAVTLPPAAEEDLPGSAPP